jgi:hypothetical protein
MSSDPSRQSPYITKLSAAEATKGEGIKVDVKGHAAVFFSNGCSMMFPDEAWPKAIAVIRGGQGLPNSDLPRRRHQPRAKQRGSWATPARVIPTFTSDTEVPMPVSQLEREPSWTKYELEAVKSLSEVERLTSLDRDTLVRVYPEYLVKLSPKRLGMKFRNVLKIMNGDATAASVTHSALTPMR